MTDPSAESHPSETGADRGNGRENGRRRPPLWLIILLVVLIAIPLIGAIALKTMFPPERLRAIAEPQIEQRIARDVELGAVALKVFPYIAIRLEDVRIANPPAGFSDAPAVRIDALDLRLELLPLLRREFRLSQVRLAGPRVRYEVAADGTNNFTGVMASDSADAEAEAEAEASDGSGSRFDIEQLVINDGEIAYLNSESRRALRFDVEGELDVSPPENEGGPLASSGEIRFENGLMVAGEQDSTSLPDVEFTYRAGFDPDDGRIVLPELTLRGAGLELTGEATSRKEGDARLVRLELASGEFEIADVLDELPEGTVADTFEIGGQARVQLAYAGELGGEPGPVLDGVATYSNVSFATPSRGQVLDAARGTMEFSSEMMRTPDLGGRLLGRPFQARVRVDDFSDPSVDAHFSGTFELDQVNDFREGEPLPVEGSAAVEIDVQGPVSEPAGLSITGPVQLSDVSYAGESLPRPVEIAAATIQLTGSGVRGDAIPMRIGDSDVSLTFSSDGLLQHYLTDEAERGAAPLIRFTAHSSRLAAADLRAQSEDVGYSDLLKARLAGALVGGEDPAEIATARYEKPDLSGYRASGVVTIDQWVNPPTNASDVSFQVDLAGGVVEISQVQGVVYGGTLSGDITADLRGAEPPFEVEYDLRLRGARAGSLLERWTRLGEVIAGTVDFDIAGTAPLDETLLPITTGFAATGSTTFVEGRFEDFGIIEAVRTRLDVAAERIRSFRDLGGPFEIRDGRFVVRNWTFATGDIQGAVSGAAGLGGILDLSLALQLPPGMLRDAPIIGNNAALSGLLGQITGAGGTDGAATIPLRLGIGGTMQNPTLQLDAAALTSSLRGRVTDTGRERLEEEGRNLLEEAAGGLLDRLGGGGDDTVQDTAAAGEDTTGAAPARPDSPSR